MTELITMRTTLQVFFLLLPFCFGAENATERVTCYPGAPCDGNHDCPGNFCEVNPEYPKLGPKALCICDVSILGVLFVDTNSKFFVNILVYDNCESCENENLGRTPQCRAQ